MIDYKKLRKLENLHIPLWLIKDTCWMMEWKVLGIAMIVPTLGVSLLIVLKTRRDKESLINLAISFWIMANAYWMCCEFLDHVELKNYAGIPFAFGFVFVTLYFLRFFLDKRKGIE